MTSRLRVTWLGHATTLLEIDGLRVLTDPVLGRRVGPLHNTSPTDPAQLGAVDVVLVSHVHRDHLDLPSLRALAPTRVVVPPGAGALLDDRHDVRELDVGDSTSVGGVTIETVPARHHTTRNPFGPVVPAVGHVVRGTQAAYVAGDTAVFPEMAALGDLALAVLPVGGWGLNLGPGHMDPEEAARALTLLRPHAVIPVHWLTLRLPVAWRLRPERYLLPGPRFAHAAARTAPDVAVHVLAPRRAVTLNG